MQPIAIIRDALVIFALTAAGGFVLGFARALAIIAADHFGMLITISDFALAALGFTISAVLNPRERWSHLLLVALCLWLICLINLAFGFTLAHWFISSIGILLAMGLGGVLSYIVAPEAPARD